jgi:pimeloyl-ACP methyl ester carboxylesterase
MSEEKKQVRITKATMPAGGWGSVGDVSTILTDQNVVVKDTGHFPHEEAPARLNRHLLTWLDGLSG